MEYPTRRGGPSGSPVVLIMPAVALDNEVISGAVSHGSRAPEAGDAAVDDARV